MKMVFGMVCLQHASSATEALFVVSKMYHHEFLDLTSVFFSKFDFSNSWHLGDVWYDAFMLVSFRTWPKDVLKKFQQDDGVGDLGQDMFEAVNLIDPTDEEVDPAVNR